MFKKQEGNHIVDVLFVLFLFGVFTLSALILVTLGANVYQNTVSHMSQNFDSRTASSYLTEKIRQNDLYDSIAIEPLEGVEALVFTQSFNGTEYGTYIYLYDGSLRELFMRKGSSIGTNPLAAGATILPLADFQAQFVEDRLLCLKLTTVYGQEKTIYASTHSH